MKTLTKLFKPAVIAALALVAFSGSAAAADEVKLLKVNSVHTPYYKGSWLSGSFEAVVANLAYSKQVSIYYKKTDGTWGDLGLSYNRAASAGKEVWSVGFSNFNLVSSADPLEFAVKYVVNGSTYWDNNGGANYKIKLDGGTILYGTNVYNGRYNPTEYISGSTINGRVTVKNLAPSKSVEVHYTTDNWATKKTATATFNPSFYNNGASTVTNPNSYGFEEWNYQLDVGTAPSVKYSIKYTVNGSTYWDNNFGRDYESLIVR